MLFFSKIGLVTALGERILLVKTLFIYVRIFKGYCPYETNLVNQSNSSNFDRNELKTELRRKQKNWMVVYVCSVAKKWLLITSMAAKMII